LRRDPLYSQFLDGLGQETVNMIRRRTLKGIDVNGKRFKKLDPEFAKIKGTTKRKLSSSGDPTKGMLGAIAFKKLGFKVVIYVKKVMGVSGYGHPYNRYIVAEVHNFGMISGRRSKGRFRMARSYFFGLNSKERQKLKGMAFENFRRFIETFRVKFWI